MRKLIRFGEDGDELWRPKDDGSERLSPFLGRRGQTTILEDADVTYDDETDGGIDGWTCWKARGSMDEITPETARVDGEVTKAGVASD